MAAHARTLKLDNSLFFAVSPKVFEVQKSIISHFKLFPQYIWFKTVWSTDEWLIERWRHYCKLQNLRLIYKWLLDRWRHFCKQISAFCKPCVRLVQPLCKPCLSDLGTPGLGTLWFGCASLVQAICKLYVTRSRDPWSEKPPVRRVMVYRLCKP